MVKRAFGLDGRTFAAAVGNKKVQVIVIALLHENFGNIHLLLLIETHFVFGQEIISRPLAADVEIAAWHFGHVERIMHYYVFALRFVVYIVLVTHHIRAVLLLDGDIIIALLVGVQERMVIRSEPAHSVNAHCCLVYVEYLELLILVARVENKIATMLPPHAVCVLVIGRRGDNGVVVPFVLQHTDENLTVGVAHFHVSEVQGYVQLLVRLVIVDVSIGSNRGTYAHFGVNDRKICLGYGTVGISVLIYAHAVVARKQRTHITVGKLQNVVRIKQRRVHALGIIVDRCFEVRACHVIALEKAFGGFPVAVAMFEFIDVAHVFVRYVVERNRHLVAGIERNNWRKRSVVVDNGLNRADVLRERAVLLGTRPGVQQHSQHERRNDCLNFQFHRFTG